MSEQDFIGRCDPVAVIGASVRLPGARDAEEFWRNLRDGVESVRFFTEDELLAAGVEPSLLAHPDYVRAGAAPDGVELFDAPFFGFHARQAELTDPQQRVMLECAWEALEQAGYAPNATGRATGVFVGSSLSHYLLDNLYPSLGSSSDIASLPLLLGNDKDYLASLVSYKLNLRGPSISVQTACSTSLVAVHLACQSLLSGECDMALAGGVSVIPQRQREGYLYVNGGHYSPDGHCRAFDASSRGTVFGNGAGVVVLKRYADAIADRDHIHAVIRGSAVNNDGSAKVGFTAPGADGQAAVIAEALAVAGVGAQSISYVEAHGTGTPLGDPIEIAALKEVFYECRERKDSCAVGSVKTNIGHLEAAAGVAGLVKAVLALEHRQLPPSLHFVSPNPELGLAESPFFVNAKLREWEPGETPRRAGVSSFGIGGTNAHVVLEEAPTPRRTAAPFERPRHLLCLSARTETALAEQTRRFAAHLTSEGAAAALGDLCYTANVGRAHFAHRLAVVGGTREELSRGLGDFLTGGPAAAVSSGVIPERHRPKVAFLFTGQGSQYVGMGRQLYDSQPIFREALDECDRFYEQDCGERLLPLLHASEEAGSPLNETRYAQPALFAVGYALSRLWRSWGIEPAAVLGHSLGEYVAACVAGVFGAAEGLRLVSKRGRLMQALRQKGTMAALLCGEERARRAIARLDGQVSLAAVNGPEDVVISGAEWAVGAVCAELEGAGVRTRRLNVSHAFHSGLIEPMLEGFADVAREVAFSAPQLPLVSNLTGRFWQKGVACDAGYWVRQAREPVLFAEGLETLREHGCDVFLEVGPGQTLLALGRKSLPGEAAAWLPSLRKGGDDWQTILQSLGALYARGVGVDWEGFDRPYMRRRVPAPTYPFERKRHWVERGRRGAGTDTRGGVARHFPGRRLKTALREAVYEVALSADSTPLLSEHRVYGTAVLPATGYVEMALAAAADGAPSARPHVVEDFVVQQALTLRGNEACTVQLISAPPVGGAASFQIFSLEGGDDVPAAPWRLHAGGKLRPAGAGDDGHGRTAAEVNALSARLGEPVPGEVYYERLRGLGIEYGPSFRGIVTLWRREGEALGLVRPSSELNSAANPSEFRAALLDACLQVVGGGLPAEREGEELYLPVGFERARVNDDLGRRGAVWSHAVFRPRAADAGAHTADLNVYGEDGRLLAEVHGLLLKRAPRAALLAEAERLDEWCYGIEWQRAEASRVEEQGAAPGRPESGRWLIFDEGRGLGESLARLLEDAGEPYVLVRPGDSFRRVSGSEWSLNPKEAEHYRLLLADCGERPLRGVIHLWGMTDEGEGTTPKPDDAQEFTCGSVLNLVKALAGIGWAEAPRLWLVTRGAQPVKEPRERLSLSQSPLWGLGRVIAREHPEFWGGLIDLEQSGSATEAAWLARAISGGGDGEDQTALRAGKRYAVRLRRLGPARKAAGVFGLRDNATYLITGGLGGLGLTVARWMHERGARHLVLLGRGAAPPSERAREVIEELRGAGTRVVVARADVCRAEDLARVLAEVEESGTPLRGVVHAAGVVDDGTLLRQGWESFQGVLAPKVAGGRNLHELTRGLPLDFFVLFSSVVSLAGPPGQGSYAAANAFLDALAHERRAEGLPAICINWGPWAEVGMAATARPRVPGDAITPASGVALLEKALMQERAQVAVLPPGWLRLARSMWGGQPSSLWVELAGEAGPSRVGGGGPAAGHELWRRLEAAPAGRRRALVVEHLQFEVGLLLGLDPSQPPDARQGLFDLGLDSLTAIEFRTRLESTFKTPLPATLAFDYPSVESVAAYLEETLWPPAEGADVAPVRIVEDEEGGRLEATAGQLELLSDEDAEAALLKKLARLEERV